MRINKLAFVGSIVLAALLSYAFGSLNSQNPSRRPVKIIQPQLGTIETFIATTGTVLPKNRLEVKSPVNGRIESILVEEGAHVKSGDIVAWMSSTERAALLDAARGKGRDALAYWQGVYKPIALVAPIDGQVIVATMQPGQTVTTADPVVVIADKLIFRAQVDETDIGRIKSGQEAVATLDAYPDTKIPAHVEHVYYESKTINNVTIYEVDLKTGDLPAVCRSGMNVSVGFTDQHKENILTVPASVVQKDQDGNFVMLKVQGASKPVKRAIKVGISDDASFEVVSGLTEHDQIVMESRKYSRPRGSSGTNPFAPARPPRR